MGPDRVQIQSLAVPVCVEFVEEVGLGLVPVLSLAVPVALCQVRSQSRGYRLGSGFNFMPVQTSNTHILKDD